MMLYLELFLFLNLINFFKLFVKIEEKIMIDFQVNYLLNSSTSHNFLILFIIKYYH